MSRYHWFLWSMLVFQTQAADAFADHRDNGLSTANASPRQSRRQQRLIINVEERERQTGIVEGVDEEAPVRAAGQADGRPNIIQAPRITLFNGYTHMPNRPILAGRH